MAISSHSLFYYGHVVTGDNNLIPFKEGAGPEKIAELPVGSYTLSRFVEIIVAALNAASSLDWGGTVNRSTRVINLTSSGPASLLFGTGSVNANTPAALAGFNATDKLNLTSFFGDFASGYSYSPQFPLQSYLPKTANKKMVNAVVTKSATGDSVSVQSFGIDRFIKGNIKFITNQPTEGVLRNNPNALEEIKDFMDFIVEKNPIEFMEDENDPDSYDPVYLESTQTDANGTSYELTEYVDRNLPEYFETGLLTFKVINL